MHTSKREIRTIDVSDERALVRASCWSVGAGESDVRASKARIRTDISAKANKCCTRPSKRRARVRALVGPRRVFRSYAYSGAKRVDQQRKMRTSGREREGRSPGRRQRAATYSESLALVLASRRHMPLAPNMYMRPINTYDELEHTDDCGGLPLQQVRRRSRRPVGADLGTWSPRRGAGRRRHQSENATLEGNAVLSAACR